MPKHPSHNPAQLVDDLLATRLADIADSSAFTAKLQALRSWLDQLDGLAGVAQSLHDATAPPRRGPGRPRKNPATAPAPAPLQPKRARKRRRGRAKGGKGEFPATAFILKTVQHAGKAGVVPADVIRRVNKAAPRKHVSTSALVHTVLRRLEGKGSVRRKRGKWYPA